MISRYLFEHQESETAYLLHGLRFLHARASHRWIYGLAATLLWWGGIKFALHNRLATYEIPAYITRIDSWVVTLLAITTSRGVKNK